MNWLILWLLVAEVVLLSLLDRALFGTWGTPFNLLAYPYAAVATAAFLFAPSLGFVPLHGDSILIWVVGLPVFWVGGLTVALVAGNAIRSRVASRQPPLYEERSTRLALTLGWIMIAIMVCGLCASLSSVGGLRGMGTERFIQAFGSGLSGHAMTLSLPLLILLIGTGRRKALILITIATVMTMLLARQVKSWIVLPLVGGLIYLASTNRFRFSLSNTMRLLLLGYALFNAAYLVGFGTRDIKALMDAKTYSALLEHFVSYAFAGVLALSEVVRSGEWRTGGDPRVIFAPLVNLYALATSGELISNVRDSYSLINVAGTKSSNVHTLFGTLLIHLGVLRASAYALGLGALAYTLFVLARLARNCWLTALWSFIAGMLALGWFEFYFWHLPAIEAPAYCVILGFVVWLHSRRPPAGWSAHASHANGLQVH